MNTFGAVVDLTVADLDVAREELSPQRQALAIWRVRSERRGPSFSRKRITFSRTARA
jgi:hypothetical protein